MRPSWRARELGLLVYPAALLALGWVQLGLAGGALDVEAGLRRAALLVLPLLLAHAWLSWRLAHADQLLLPISAGLAALGILVVARLEGGLAIRQTAWVAIGLLGMVAASALLPGIDWLKRYRYSLAAFGLLLVVATLALGVDPNGGDARLWLGLGGLYFQPTELMKLLLAVFFAAYLDDYRELLEYDTLRVGPLALPPLPYLLPLLAMLGLTLGLVLFQRDLGAALLLFGIFLSLLFVASGRWSYVLLGLVLFAAGALLAYQLFEHVRVRFDIWLDPWADRDGAGYQIVQALYALGAGGLFGAGLGLGYPGYVPAAHTDFVIAAIGEELGLLGTLAVVALYMLFVARGLRIALRARVAFSGLLATGLTAVVGIQTLVILGGTLRLLPLTGVTLPLVSYGGSSILANFVLVGLLLRISHESEAG
jgi:cell division protein FtsW (lipid II flippase)